MGVIHDWALAKTQEMKDNFAVAGFNPERELPFNPHEAHECVHDIRLHEKLDAVIGLLETIEENMIDWPWWLREDEK